MAISTSDLIWTAHNAMVARAQSERAKERAEREKLANADGDTTYEMYCYGNVGAYGAAARAYEICAAMLESL